MKEYTLKRNDLFNIVTIFFIVVGVLLFRRHDAFINPQLCSEDGSIFLQQYQDVGLKSLIIPYAGYFHLLPRLISLLFGSLSVPYTYIPASYSASAFVITFLVAVRLWKTASYSHIKHPIMYATVFLFIPISGEPFMNMTNTIWLGALYLTDFIFIGYKCGNKYLNYLLVFIFSLSGPFSLLLSPIIILIIIIERKKISIDKVIPLVLIIICGCIQFISIKMTGKMHREYWVDTPPDHLIDLITNNASELFFFKSKFLSAISDKAEVILGCILFLVFLFLILIRYNKITYERKYVLLLAPIIFFVSYIIAWWPYASKFTALGWGARYYFIPYTCLAWILIVSINPKISYVYIGIYSIFFLLQYKHVTLTLPDMQWKQKLLEYYEGKRSVIEINPGGIWVFKPHKKI